MEIGLRTLLRACLDEWGRTLTRNIIEPQPMFTEATHKFAEEMASQYGLKRVPFIRTLTAFYLNHVVNRPDFDELKKYCELHVSRKLLASGTKSKVSVPIRYLMYQKVQTFSDVWQVPHAKVIEDATLFGLTALSSKEENLEKLKTIAESLSQYIAEFAQVA